MRIYKQEAGGRRRRRNPKGIAVKILRGGWRALCAADRSYLEKNAPEVLRFLDPDLARAIAEILGIPMPPGASSAPIEFTGYAKRYGEERMTVAEAGRIGGYRRAARLGPKRLSQENRKAALARWSK